MQKQNTATNTTTYDATTTQNPSQANSRVVQELKAQGYTDGLIHSIQRNHESFPLRIWVVDNSHSMTMRDGHSLEQTTCRIRSTDCTRWDEIVGTVNHHAKTAALLEAPTTFRLLNPAGDGTSEFGVAERGPEHTHEDLEAVLATMRRIRPKGATPLAERVAEITADIESRKDDLRSRGQKAVVILATDGLPSNRAGKPTSTARDQFRDALRRMEGLPVWVVIRLCTDNEEVVNYYNNIDHHLELSLDVLDDYFAEALEVYEHNRWLNYALPLHRMREMGFYHKLFDLIDERPLTKDELPEFFRLLYGADVLDGLPDPQLEWDKFLERIADVTSSMPNQWNPVKRRRTPWVRIESLNRTYGGRLNAASKFAVKAMRVIFV